MNSRERMLAVIDHKPVDRIPSDIWATDEVWQQLGEHFGTHDERKIKDHLGIDGIEYVNMDKCYTGKDRTLPDGTQTEIWGTRFRQQALPTGGEYREQVCYPLKEVTDVKALDDFNWESPADYDFEKLARDACHWHENHIVWAGYLIPCVDLWTLFGQEATMLNLALYPELIEATLDRVMTYRLEQHRLLFEAVKGHADLAHVTDDFGSQKDLVMSHDMIRHFFWPHYRSSIKLAKKYGLRIFHHDDGAMSRIIPDLIEMGVEILNPIQWTCPGMELERLKREYGKDLCFHGAVENQRIIPFGTPDEVRQEVRNCLRILASDGTGYIIAPCHAVQSGTPLENILAVFDEIQESGRMS